MVTLKRRRSEPSLCSFNCPSIAPSLPLAPGVRCALTRPHPTEQGMLQGGREPQEVPAGVRDNLPGGVEEQEAEPHRPGGPEISG